MIRKHAALQVLEAWKVPSHASPESLRKVAHRVDFQYEARKGYLYVRARAISSRCNDNHDAFPEDEIEKGWKSFIGKPVFVNHHNSNHRRARGVIVAAALHRDRNPDGSPDTWVEVLQEVDAARFPLLAKAILARRVNRTSMGVDVEWSKCSACGNKATSPAEYCRHLPALKGKKIRKRGADGKLREEIIREICHGLSFFENSLLVEDPADPTAFLLGEPDARGLKMSASRHTAAPAGPHPGRLQGGSCKENCTYGGTHCLMCHEPVAINLHKTDTSTAGWHHADSMKRDHPAIPSDGESVISSIPAQQAQKDQAREHVNDVLERQGLPRRQPQGMPPDPFTASLRKNASADDDNLYALTGCHHTSCGRTLHRGRTASVQINEDRLHSYTPDAPSEPDRRLIEGARSYSAKAGLPDPHESGYSHVETHPDRLRRLARAYDSLPMNDRNAHHAFADMGRQVHDQYHHLTHTMGIKVEPVDHDPYPDHHSMLADLRDNKRLQVLKTATTGPHGFFDDNTNDKFRAVHDAFGHAATGRSFDRHGEEAAWLAHSRMFHGPARHAMTTETRGQNSMLIATGQFAPQKTALLPPSFLSREASMLTTAPPLAYVPLMAEAASRPAYQDPADHPFFKANPVNHQHIVDAYFAATDDQRNLGHRWYSDAHHLARAISGNDPHKGGGVLSSYSPQAGWGINMHNASKAFRAHAAGEEIPGKGSGAMSMHQKAASRILSGESIDKVLRAPKTNAFAHLIEHGGDSPEDKARGHSLVVVDRHAMSTAIGRRTTGDDDLSFLSNPHYYNHVADTFRHATHEINQKTGLNLDPHMTQAAVWGWQKSKNDAEDEHTAAGKGRKSREVNDFRRWNEHATDAHPDIPRGGAGNMHVSVRQAYLDAIRALAYGEDKVPAQVNTLRAENCPVCGEQDAWSGERCPVCGFVTPPSMFRDPDTDKAGEVRDQLDSSGEVNLPSEADEAAQSARNGEGGDPQGSDPDADRQMDHPDQVAPDGVPAAQQGSDTQAEQNPEDPSEEPQDEANAQASMLGCPACGAQLGAQEPGAAEGAPCPQCGNGRLGPVANDPAAQKEQRPSGPGGTVMGSAKDSAAAASVQRQAALERENRVLRAQLAMLGSLAGVGPEMDAIRRQADVMNPGSPVPDPPEQPATQSTEEALAAGSSHAGGGQQGSAPMGGGHSVDDVSRPGTTPGSVTNVPAVQTTTPITPGVEIPTAPATNLQDVTAPVTGTNPAQDGGVPLDQRRIETDVRIDPDPLKASGPGIGGMGNDGTAFPWLGGDKQDQMAKGASLQDQQAERTFAAIRLARLRVQAGLDQGDELTVAAGIERDATLSLPVIAREIETLGRVASAQPRRPSQQRTASRPPSLAPSGAPMMAYASAASTDAGDAEDIFLG
jgi:hypothetical protein